MPGVDKLNAKFKYTIPIARAISENGDLFLEGEATGPELDTFGTRMDPALITAFADQIATRARLGDPIPYRDTHGMGVTGDNGVMSDLGELVAANITDAQHLMVRVRLYANNPAAKYLYESVQAGKRYGMSIGGAVVDFVDEYVKDLGKVVRTFKNIVLDHVANTSQPSWTPSLGTVLTRAVEEALQGDNMDESVPAPESPEVEGATENTAAEPEPVAEAVESTETPDVVNESSETAEESEPAAETVAVSALQPIFDAANALATAIAALTAPAQLAPAPVAAERSAANDAARSVESESPVVADNEMPALRSALESLRTELAQANDRIRQLEQEPAGNQPPVVERAETNLQEELAKLDPHQRLLIGLQARQANK